MASFMHESHPPAIPVETTNTTPAPEDAVPNPDIGDFVSVSVESSGGFTSISIEPPEGSSRTPCDICCVVDVSGSMSTEAKMVSSDSGTESHGFTILDIVKHALRTIIHTLDDGDRLALVAYNSSARTVFDLVEMNEAGKRQAETGVNGMQPGGTTNIWDGLHTGMEILRNAPASGRYACVLLLTDGLPNVIPPRGHIPMLQKYRDQHQQLPCRINTFGFGYSLDSELLSDFAREGNGMYSFIPDCAMVGTVFVNALSNLLSTFATNITLSIEPTNGAQIQGNTVLGGYPAQFASWGVSMDLGSLSFGQSKDIVLPWVMPERDSSVPYLELCVACTHVRSGKQLEIKEVGTVETVNSEKVANQKFRLKLADCLTEVLKASRGANHASSRQMIEDLCREMDGSGINNSYIDDMKIDLQREATLAIANGSDFNRWGKHYLPSLLQAHRLQQCNNFKDPGVQHYGGSLFQQIRDIADDAFCKLPPPKPSRPPVSGAAPRRPVSMASYNNASNPCFAGESLVLMANRDYKQVKSIVAGDQVYCQGGKPSRVACVVKTQCGNGKACLAAFEGGLLVTPYHPVKMGGQWHFPCDLVQVLEYPCEYVYSFVLEDNHSMMINGIECITLGHKLEENEVVKHAYFGTDWVIQDLKRLPGWAYGLVELGPNAVVRNEKSGRICRLASSLDTSGIMCG
jgi:hypothetical protein